MNKEMVVELNSIRLYQPQDVLQQRLSGGAAPLSNYIKALQKSATDFWVSADPPTANGFFVAVGVKPDKTAKVWCEAVDGEIPADVIAKLEKKLGEVRAVAIKQFFH